MILNFKSIDTLVGGFAGSFDKPVAVRICGLLGLLKPIVFTFFPSFTSVENI